MENEAIFCPQCGTKNAATNAFCFACGTPLPRAAEPSPSEPTGPAEAPGQDDFTDLFAPSEPTEPAEAPGQDDFTDPFAPSEPTEPTATPGQDDAAPAETFRPAELTDFDAPTEAHETDDFTDLLAPFLTAKSAAQPAETPEQDGFTDPIDPSATPEPAPRPATRSVRKAFASPASAVALTLLTVFTCATLLLGLLSYSFSDLLDFFGKLDDILALNPMVLLENVDFLLNLLQAVFRVFVLLGAMLAFSGATKRGRGMQNGGLTMVRIGAVAAFTACLARLAVIVMELLFNEKAVNADLAPLPMLETAELVWQVLTIAFAALLPVLYLLLFHTVGGMKRVVRYEDPCERVSLVAPSVFLLLFGLLTVAIAVLPCVVLFSILPSLWSMTAEMELTLLYGFFELLLAVGVFVLAGYLLQLRVRLKRSSTAE